MSSLPTEFYGGKSNFFLKTYRRRIEMIHDYLMTNIPSDGSSDLKDSLGVAFTDLKSVVNSKEYFPGMLQNSQY
ncbi:hypothetical protein RclHR1_08440004 [Rhizophagus clarus]|uniref:Uncharacterized protein n=1 Tax=Rhizophagus clarus TaxID=94130 RepID=A0A2Z6S7B3_9GLOM|nr:hypothetical protein RclHR1_08440004 [Rhizophagus clarus]